MESEYAEAFETVFITCEEYPSTGFGLSTRDDRAKKASRALRILGDALAASIAASGWKMVVSDGVGAFPKNPWIVFCPEGLNAPKEGEFLCLVFAANGKGFIAGAMSATKTKTQWSGSVKTVDKDWGLSINGSKPDTKYSDAFFNPSPFYRNDFDFADLSDHLKRSIGVLERIHRNEVAFLMRELGWNFKCDDQFVQSVLTKPFTILTGGSGSGKTKLAESLAATLRNADEIDDSTNHAIVPVGADWTDNRQVLGFVNHLRTTLTGEGESASELPVYQTTPVLDLLLEASRPGNETFPFFLILDEMNLSHVERYFSDFLSVMEQRNGVLTLHSEGPGEEENFRLPRYAEDPIGVPRTLPYPQNLFVIGTVNVDETTYMFSPKVLDRANVIEFEVEKEEISSFLNGPHEYPEPPKAVEGVAESFLALAKKARLDPDDGGLKGLSGTAAEKAPGHLVDLFELLNRGRFEFAYRTANEVMRYLRVCRYLAAEESDKALAEWEKSGWRDDLDAQIVQKILPKLHGSMGRVGRLLGALTAYCGGSTVDEAFHYFPGGKEGSDLSISGLPLQNALEPVEGGGHYFNKSRTKLETMIQVLLEEQFVSFIN